MKVARTVWSGEKAAMTSKPYLSLSPAIDESPVRLTAADQFAALELADDYYPNLNISGKLTKTNGTLTVINKDGVTVTICDDYLEITGENVKQRINYDIAESTFRAALQKVTMQAIY